MRAWMVSLGLAVAACNQVFGLDPPTLDDATGPDASVECADVGGFPDEDGDGYRDACDNCPHLFQATDGERKDSDEDGIGAACDPHSTPDRMVAFYSFAGPLPDTVLHRLTDPGAGSWTFRQGDLTVENNGQSADMFARIDVGLRDVTVDVDVSLPLTFLPTPKSDHQAIGVWAQVELPGAAGYDPTYPPGLGFDLSEHNGVVAARSARVFMNRPGSPPPDEMVDSRYYREGMRYRIVLDCAADKCEGTVSSVDFNAVKLSLSVAGVAGAIGVRARGVNPRFHHLVVYTPR